MLSYDDQFEQAQTPSDLLELSLELLDHLATGYPYQDKMRAIIKKCIRRVHELLAAESALD